MRVFFRWLAAVLFVLAGANHFRQPELYLSIMPPYLPWPRRLVEISGVAEILGGLGLLPPRLRAPAGWGLIALLLAVWPANFHMAQHGFRGLPRWILWARLPLQLVFIAWVYWIARPPPRTTPHR